ncbi:hypothetical protein ACOMHN_060124 [Nucella lapillus]
MAVANIHRCGALCSSRAMDMPQLLTWTLLVLALCSGGAGQNHAVRIRLGHGEFSSRLCGDVDLTSTMELKCPLDTWFHVRQKASSTKAISNCSGMPPSENNAVSMSSHSPPMDTACRGLQRKVEVVHQLCDESIQGRPNRSIAFAEITYQCINITQDVQYNMCERLSQNVTSANLYLASPSFFPPSSAADDVNRRNVTCHCAVTFGPGDFKAHALYMSQLDDLNMTCQQCCIKLTKQHQFPAVNEPLFTAKQGNVFYVDFLPYSSHNVSQQNELWIHITGLSEFVFSQK